MYRFQFYWTTSSYMGSNVSCRSKVEVWTYYQSSRHSASWWLKKQSSWIGTIVQPFLTVGNHFYNEEHVTPHDDIHQQQNPTVMNMIRTQNSSRSWTMVSMNGIYMGYFWLLCTPWRWLQHSSRNVSVFVFTFCWIEDSLMDRTTGQQRISLQQYNIFIQQGILNPTKTWNWKEKLLMLQLLCHM